MNIQAKTGRVDHRRRRVIGAAVDDGRRGVVAAVITPMAVPAVRLAVPAAVAMIAVIVMPVIVAVVMRIGDSRDTAGKQTDGGEAGKPAPEARLNWVTHDAVS
jgi:hypothetical protein